jgi:hypothetical protein
MFVHAVYFWLRNDLSRAEKDRFRKGLDSLAAIEGVRHAYIGKPAPTDRPVIDRSYSAALVLVFDDEAAQEAYQVHPVHDRFRKECASFWTNVRIYDSIGDAP